MEVTMSAQEVRHLGLRHEVPPRLPPPLLPVDLGELTTRPYPERALVHPRVDQVVLHCPGPEVDRHRPTQVPEE